MRSDGDLLSPTGEADSHHNPNIRTMFPSRRTNIDILTARHHLCVHYFLVKRSKGFWLGLTFTCVIGSFLMGIICGPHHIRNDHLQSLLLHGNSRFDNANWESHCFNSSQGPCGVQQTALGSFICPLGNGTDESDESCMYRSQDVAHPNKYCSSLQPSSEFLCGRRGFRRNWECEDFGSNANANIAEGAEASQTKEFVELLVHPTMLSHDHPKRVAILMDSCHVHKPTSKDNENFSIAAGVLEQVLQYRSVQQVDVVLNYDNYSDSNFGNACSAELDLLGNRDERIQVVQGGNVASWIHERILNHNHDGSLGVVPAVIETALDVILFDSSHLAARLLADEELVLSLKKTMTDEGIIVLPTISPPVTYEWIENLAKADFSSAVTYEGATKRAYQKGRLQSLVLRNQYLVVMSDDTNRANWFSNEATIMFRIREKISPRASHIEDRAFKLHFFDGATMQAIKFPSRLEEDRACELMESLDCGDDEGHHGFSTELKNEPSSYLQVKVSGVGELAGRGLYASRDIPKGSLIALDDCANNIFIPPQAYDKLFGMVEKYNASFWRTFASYINSYGWRDDSMGAESASLDTGIMTFVNHGCNGTYNYGYNGPVNEQTAKLGIGAAGNGMVGESAIYNPSFDRFMDGIGCLEVKSLRDIKAGEEILDNYILYGGILPDGFERYLAMLKSMCFGHAGWVTEYEESHSK